MAFSHFIVDLSKENPWINISGSRSELHFAIKRKIAGIKDKTRKIALVIRSVRTLFLPKGLVFDCHYPLWPLDWRDVRLAAIEDLREKS